MSIMVIPSKHYKYVYRKAATYEYRTICDINFCHALSMSEIRLRNLLSDWCKMNYISYCRKYGKMSYNPCELTVRLIQKLRIDNMKVDCIDTYQMLSALSCIRYNIEETYFTEEEMKEFAESLKTLDNAITEIQWAIIRQIPQYKNAKWVLE